MEIKNKIINKLDRMSEKYGECGNEQKVNYVELYFDSIKNEKYCSECSTYNDNDNKYCINCGHKLKKIDENDKSYKEYCPICQDMVNKDDDFCGKYGHKIVKNEKKDRCPICGEWGSLERYCWNCGHDRRRTPEGVSRVRDDNFINHNQCKKCPHCGKTHQRFFHYCVYCGTKLEIKRSILEKIF